MMDEIPFYIVPGALLEYASRPTNPVISTREDDLQKAAENHPGSLKTKY